MQKELRILMLEDSVAEAERIEAILRGANLRFTAQIASGESFGQLLESFKPDIVIAGHPSPAMDSIRILDICSRKKTNTQVIIVTDGVSEEFAVQALKHGAFDYILKANVSRLPAAVTEALRHRRHEHSRRKHEMMLRQQNEELKKLNRDLDMFVHSTTHNLRAPLRSVLGLIHLSRQELAKNQIENLNQYYGLMENSILVLDDTIKLILDYSRTKELVEEVEAIDFEKMFEEIFSGLGHINSPESISTTVVIHPENKYFGSRMQLHLVLLNIISNAIKYYDPSKDQPFIRVEVFQHPEEVSITIEDNGIGIRRELQERVFDMFYRATESSEGSGLGLYIVKETVERLGGTVELSSAPGVGTTFHLVIPNYAASVPV